MIELLEKIENFNRNLDLESLENFNIDNKVEEINFLEEQTKEKKIILEELEIKLGDLQNYKKNGQELYDLEREKNLLNLIKEAELNENFNNSLINQLNIEMKYEEFEDIKALKIKQLEEAKSKISSLNNITEEYKSILTNFRNLKSKNNDLYDEKLQADINKVELLKFEISNNNKKLSVLNYDYRNKIDDLKKDINNGNCTFEEAKSRFEEFVDNIDPAFLQKDFEDRTNELEINKSAQLILQKEINNLQNKLENKDNYLMSIFIEERNNDISKKWNIKLDNTNLELEKIKIEDLKQSNDLKEYKDIILLCKEENLEIGKMIRDGGSGLDDKLQSNRNVIKEALESIKEIEIEKENTQKRIVDLESKKDRISKLCEGRKNNVDNKEYNESNLRLDESKLATMVSNLNALKNREKYLSISLEENIDSINKINETKPELSENKVGEVDSEKNEISEIVSIKRPLKEKMKEKIKKIAKVVIASMTTLLLFSNPTINNNELVEKTIDNNRIEQSIDENEIEQLIDNNKISENMKDNELADILNKNEIDISDMITINDNAYIYKNQNDAADKTNPYNPMFDKKAEREVIAVSVRNAEGDIKFIKKQEELTKMLNSGYEEVSYLTSHGDETEGFWNSKDVSKVINLEKGLEGEMLK